MRDALVDLAPDAVRVRLAGRHRLSRRQWLLAPAAAVLGSVTHLAWDAFTHPGRWGVAHVAWLRADLGPLPAFRWAQYASGVIDLAVVLCAVIADLRSRPTDRRLSAQPGPTAWWRVWPGWMGVSTPLPSTVSSKASSPRLLA